MRHFENALSSIKYRITRPFRILLNIKIIIIGSIICHLIHLFDIDIIFFQSTLMVNRIWILVIIIVVTSIHIYRQISSNIGYESSSRSIKNIIVSCIIISSLRRGRSIILLFQKISVKIQEFRIRLVGKFINKIVDIMESSLLSDGLDFFPQHLILVRVLDDLQTVGGLDGGLLHVAKILEELILAVGILEELVDALGPRIGLVNEIEAENDRVSEDEDQEENSHDSAHRKQGLGVFELQGLRLHRLIQIDV